MLLGLRAGGQGLTGALDSYRATLSVRRYKHEELEGAEVGTAFKNNTVEGELMGGHRAIGRMKGQAGAWILDRAFGASGAEALSPDVDQRALSAFLFEEVTWPHFRFQFGGRVDNTTLHTRWRGRTFLHQRIGIDRNPVHAPGGARSTHLRGESGACRSQSRPRGAVLLRTASGQLCIRSWQSGPGTGARTRLRCVDAVASCPRLW